MTALTAEELFAWVETTSTRWRDLIAAHPEILALPCDVLATGDVSHLLQHITLVELRYAQRLSDLPETPYDAISTGSLETLYAPHDQAMSLLRALLAQANFPWEESITFLTRSAGTLQAPRRAILVHAMMHSIRHYAQLATLVRQHGIQPGWGMDYLFMAAIRP